MSKRFSLAQASKRQLFQALARQRQVKLQKSFSGVKVIETVPDRAANSGDVRVDVRVKPASPRFAQNRIVVGKSYGMASFNNRPVDMDVE